MPPSCPPVPAIPPSDIRQAMLTVSCWLPLVALVCWLVGWLVGWLVAGSLPGLFAPAWQWVMRKVFFPFDQMAQKYIVAGCGWWQVGGGKWRWEFRVRSPESGAGSCWREMLGIRIAYPTVWVADRQKLKDINKPRVIGDENGRL